MRTCTLHILHIHFIKHEFHFKNSKYVTYAYLYLWRNTSNSSFFSPVAWRVIYNATDNYLSNILQVIRFIGSYGAYYEYTVMLYGRR